MTTVSIVMPAYNAGQFITETLETIAAQSFSDFECLVVDDGSTDGTAALVWKFGDERFKVITIENSGGPAKPRNVGIANAKGKYLFLFDSDDLMATDKLETYVEIFESNPSIDMLCSNFNTIDENGDPLGDDYLAKYENLWNLVPIGSTGVTKLPRAKVFTEILRNNFVGTSSVALRVSSLIRSQVKFDERLRNTDDRLFWLEFAKKNQLAFINRILHSYRVRRGNITSKGIMGRGKSKLLVMETIMTLCETEEQMQLVKNIIKVDAASMAWGYRKQKNYKEAISAARTSLSCGVNYFALKSFVLAVGALALTNLFWSVASKTKM